MLGLILFMLNFDNVWVSPTLMDFSTKLFFLVSVLLCFFWISKLLFWLSLCTLICWLDGLLLFIPFTRLSFFSLCITPITIMTCISCAITLNTAFWRNIYLPNCNVFWQRVNIWATLDSSFPQRAHSISSSNLQRAWFCGDSEVLYVPPRQNKTNQGVYKPCHLGHCP